jgi:signal peptidase I
MMFALFMVAILAITGLVWLADVLFLAKRRAQGAAEPVVVEYSKSFFPVILAVFMIRSFLVEPFKIPSGSMIPTLLVGDFILVNKYTYGLRVPILNNVFFEMNHPQHGDVMVFHYPNNPSTDYIKRVIGVPGDTVDYHNKQLTINGKEMAVKPDGKYEYIKDGLNYVHSELQYETLDDKSHARIVIPEEPTLNLMQVQNFPYIEQCKYDEEGFTCVVPEGHYFMMGDNRDNSNDSRYWGFVPERNIVGKAFMIWWNFDDFGRIGNTIH